MKRTKDRDKNNKIWNQNNKNHNQNLNSSENKLKLYAKKQFMDADLVALSHVLWLSLNT